MLNIKTGTEIPFIQEPDIFYQQTIFKLFS